MKLNFKKIILTAAILVISASSVFAVISPIPGTSTPNGKFIFVPDLAGMVQNTTNQRIRVISTDLARGAVGITKDATGNPNEGAIIQTIPTPHFWPTSMAVNSAGTFLYVVLCKDGTAPYYSYVKSYSIAANGILTEVGSVQLLDANSTPRGCALTQSGGYLYVADSASFSGNRKIRRIKISNNSTTLSEETPSTLVPGANMKLHGVTINNSGNRLFVSVYNPDPAIGQVLMYDISTENSPGYMASMPSCPYASFMKVSPDDSKLFVKVLETSSPYTDIKVFSTAFPYTLLNNLSISNPADHSLAGYSTSTGYAAGHYNADYANDNAGLVISPDQKYLYFSHYVSDRGKGVFEPSGSGTWHPNINIMTFDLNDLSKPAWSSNGGNYFFSADSMVVTSDRIWMLYSDGAQIRSTLPFGPAWVSHGIVASNEATIVWAPQSNAGSYDIQYYPLGRTSEARTITGVSASLTEYKITTGLLPMTTYEAKVRTVKTNGDMTDWTPNQYSTGEVFYTLEQVWVNHFNVLANEATIIFGPVISKGVKNVPYAARYDLDYRIKGEETAWTRVNVISPPDNGTNYTYKLTGLTSSKTYEIRMRAVDASEGVSEWSTKEAPAYPYDTFFTMERPWVSHAKVTSTGLYPSSLYILWGPETSSGLNVPNATYYEFMYRMRTDPESAWSSPSTLTTTRQDDKITLSNVLNLKMTRLASSETYEFKIRAGNASGVSEWGTNEAYMLERPWVASVNTTDTDTYIIWGPEMSKTLVNIPDAVGYRFRYRKLGDTPWSAIIDLSLGRKDDPTIEAMNYHLTGLTGATTYEVLMWAYDSKNEKSDMATASFITIRGPRWLDVNVTGTREATIFWDPTAAAPQYEVRYSKVASADGGTAVTTTDVQLAVTGLDAFTKYYAKVRAITPSGASDWTNVISFETVPGPKWISSYSTTTTSTSLTWEGISLPTSISYQVSYGTLEAGPESLENGSRNFMTLSGLQARKWYKAKVRLVSYVDTTQLGWSAYSPIHQFFTIPAPTYVELRASTPTTALVTWDAVFFDDALTIPCTSYEATWGLTPEAVGVGHVVTSEIHYMLTELTTGVNYYLKIRARDDAMGGWSDWVPMPAFLIEAGKTPPPGWLKHYMVTSHEAVVDWGTVEVATKYIVQYRMAGTSTWTSREVSADYKYNVNESNPNCQLTGLTELSTYEVNVIAKEGTKESNPTKMDTFYTLERPWVDTFNPDSNETYVVWGPEVSTSEIAVPLSDHYEMQYSRDGGKNWYDSLETMNNSSFAMALETGKLNILYDGLIANSTYEVKVRTVDNNGGVSDWSEGKIFHTLRGPRWVDATILSKNEANIFWEDVGAPQYELMYSKAPSAEGGAYELVSGATAFDAAGLDAFTTYYAKARAITTFGNSDWSSVKKFDTIPGPKWVSNYSTTTTTTELMWDPASGITSFEVSYGVSAEPMSWTDLALPSPTQTDFGPIEGLTERTWYRARARAHTDEYVSQWVFDYFFTIPAPTMVRCTGITITTADITWEPVNLDTAGIIPCTSYEVSWGLTPEAVGIGNIVTDQLNCKLENLTTGTNYYVKVRARDDEKGGWSDWSPYPSLPVTPSDGPTIFDIDPKSGIRGTTVKITGQNFGTDMGTVMFGTTPAQPGSWNNGEIAVSVPPKAVAGPNVITVTDAFGNPAFGMFSYDVKDGGFVIDDFEGGAWQYVTWEAGTGGNSMIFGPKYTDSYERVTHMTVECAGTAQYEILGGVSPYGDLPTEEGYDISAYKTIKLWFKGDGSSNVATFELIESNTAPGNRTDIALATEIWKYSVPMSMVDTNWHEITIKLSTIDAAGKFEIDTTWFMGGDKNLDFSRIKAYQILTSGGNPKKYYVDDVLAGKRVTDEEGSRIYAIRYIDELNSENWISVPFSGTGITDSIQLAQAISDGMPAGTFVAGDTMVVTVRNNATQTSVQGWNAFDPAGGGNGTWADMFASPVAINAGDAVQVVISNPSRLQIDGTWKIEGGKLAVGSGGKQYNIKYIDELNSENWISLLDNITGVTDSVSLAQAISDSMPAGTFIAGDTMVVTVRNNVTQTSVQGWNAFDPAGGGNGTWADMFASPVAISTNDFVSVVISNGSGRPELNGLWP